MGIAQTTSPRAAVSAQPPNAKRPAPKPNSPLEKRLAEADAAFQARDFAKAFELYRQVDAIESTVKTRMGIADCLRELSKYPDAYDAYNALLRDKGASLPRNDFEHVQQALSALNAATAVLAIDVKEPGALVTLDNLSLGSSPIDVSRRLMPGTVSVAVAKQGFETWSQKVALRGGEERRLSVALSPVKVTGTVVARTNSVEPSELWVDGKSAGPLPFIGELPAGEHVIVARSASGESAPRKLDVTAGGRFEVELATILKPGSLRVSATDAAALVEIDGTPVGSGRYEGPIAPGNHVIKVERAGFEPKVTSITVEPGEQVAIDNVTLESLSSLNAKKPDYRGLYLRLSLEGLFGKPTTSVATDCPAANVGGSCSSYIAAGGAVDTRVGYSFGMLGAEVFTLLATTVSAAQMTFPTDTSAAESAWYGIARKESYAIVNPSIAIGAAGRVSSQSPGLRLSSAWGAGVAWHMGYVGRSLEALPSNTQDGIVRVDAVAIWQGSSAWLLPIFVWDADIELGDTPGTRLILGIHSQIEFGKGPNVNAGSGGFGYRAVDQSRIPFGGGDVRPWGSPAFLVGPKIGLIIGH